MEDKPLTVSMVRKRRERESKIQDLWFTTVPGVQHESENDWLNKHLIVVFIGFCWKQTLK